MHQITFCLKVKRPGDKNVRCTILLLLDYQPLQFKLDPRLARLLGVHTQTRPAIISALWQYIKTHRLQVCMSVFSMKYSSSASIMIGCRLRRPGNLNTMPVMGGDFCLLHSLQSACGVIQACCS